jgi:hypothetical protein
MKKFLAVYMGSDTGENAKKWAALDEKTRAAREASGMQGWMGWMEKNEKVLADGGSPLGDTLRVDAKGVAKASNPLCGYAIVEAETHEAAAKLFLNHPHFAIFPGDAVEVMECLPIPGM